MPDYFLLLGIDYNLQTEDEQVRQNFLNLIRANHPDQFVSDPGKLEAALQKSIEINAAFKQLKTFEGRVEHWLQLAGKETEADKKPADMEFLMEMMEINDLIEETEPGNKTQWETVNTALTNRYNGIAAQMKKLATELLLNNPQDLTVLQNLPQNDLLRQEFQKLNYIKRLKNNLQLKSKP